MFVCLYIVSTKSAEMELMKGELDEKSKECLKSKHDKSVFVERLKAMHEAVVRLKSEQKVMKDDIEKYFTNLAVDARFQPSELSRAIVDAANLQQVSALHPIWTAFDDMMNGFENAIDVRMDGISDRQMALDALARDQIGVLIADRQRLKERLAIEASSTALDRSSAATTAAAATSSTTAPSAAAIASELGVCNILLGHSAAWHNFHLAFMQDVLLLSSK